MKIRYLLFTFIVLGSLWIVSAGQAQNDDSSGAMNPLDASMRDLWKVKNGKWKFEQDYCLTGAGDSSITFNKSFKTPFHLTTDIEVIEGIRPRIIIGPYRFSNEGYKPTFSFYPEETPDNRFPYEIGRTYKLDIDITADKIEVSIDGHSIGGSSKGLDVVPPIIFRGGDDWSSGTTRFAKIRITGTPVADAPDSKAQ